MFRAPRLRPMKEGFTNETGNSASQDLVKFCKTSWWSGGVAVLIYFGCRVSVDCICLYLCEQPSLLQGLFSLIYCKLHWPSRVISLAVLISTTDITPNYPIEQPQWTRTVQVVTLAGAINIPLIQDHSHRSQKRARTLILMGPEEPRRWHILVTILEENLGLGQRLGAGCKIKSIVLVIRWITFILVPG